MATATTSVRLPRARAKTATSGRAYGGPAHGYCWPIDDEMPPEALDIAPGHPPYRLIHHPWTHQPAKDHLGNYLYMPVGACAAGHPTPNGRCN